LGKEGTLQLPSSDVTAFDVRGERVKVERSDGKQAVPLDRRRITLRFPGQSAEEARKILGGATLSMRKPVVLWIRAEDSTKSVGNMTLASRAGIRDPDSLSDPILCSGKIDPSGKTPAYCEYRVEIPRQGRWNLWARVRYPHGGDLSFGLIRPGEPVTLSGNQVLGNCGLNQARWHWTGHGGGSTTPPPGSPIVLSPPAGPLVFQIWPREGGGTAAINPRLDCLCLVEDPDYMPTDADARVGLAKAAK
jgi:hypothetical protein